MLIFIRPFVVQHCRLDLSRNFSVSRTCAHACTALVVDWTGAVASLVGLALFQVLGAYEPAESGLLARDWHSSLRRPG